MFFNNAFNVRFRSKYFLITHRTVITDMRVVTELKQIIIFEDTILTIILSHILNF